MVVVVVVVPPLDVVGIVPNGANVEKLERFPDDTTLFAASTVEEA